MKSTKLLLATLLLITLPLILFSQVQRDIVKLKNGSLIKGRIIEQIPNEKLRIRTSDGSEFVFKMDEIERISIEESIQQVTQISPIPPVNKIDPPDSKLYGGSVSLGVALGGGGILGVPIRISPGKKIALEIGVFMRPTYTSKKPTYYDQNGNEISETSENEFSIPPMFVGGLDVFFSETYKPYGDKIVKNGMFFRGGKTLNSDLDETMIAIGWVKERFKAKRKKSSFLLNLGAGIIKYDEEIALYGSGIETDIVPIFYWKLAWNWYLL